VGDKLCFILFLPPSFFFPPQRLHCATNIFTAPTCTGVPTINSLERCALNAKFQHFILIFNKISLLCAYQLKEGFEGEKRPKVRTGVTLQKRNPPHKFLFEKTITNLPLSFRVFTCNLLFVHTKPLQSYSSNLGTTFQKCARSWRIQL